MVGYVHLHLPKAQLVWCEVEPRATDLQLLLSPLLRQGCRNVRQLFLHSG